MPKADTDEDLLLSAHTSAEVTGVDDDVGKCTAESVEEAQKEIPKTDLIKPYCQASRKLSHVK